MRILSIHVYRWLEEDSALMTQAHEVNFAGYFERKVLREMLNFNGRQACNGCRPGDRTAVHLEGEKGIAYVAIHPSTLGIVVIADPEYPQRVAFGLIAELMDEFQQLPVDLQAVVKDTAIQFPKVEEFLQRYQNPVEADRLMKIQSELDQVTEIMHKNIDEVLKRGETLESLMAKSKDMSTVSYGFYKKAKKNNQCCKLY